MHNCHHRHCTALNLQRKHKNSDPFSRKPLLKKIQDTASARSRVSQEWYHQIEDRWATERALTDVYCIYARTLGTEGCTVVNSWLLHYYSEF